MTLQLVRAFLLLIFLIGTLGTGTQLLLLGHTESTSQYLPLILLGIALVVIGWYTVARSRTAVRSFRWLTLLFILSGVIGIILHYRGNVAHELGMVPDLGGVELFGKAVSGTAPALAPGTMIILGLIGWVYAFRHPVTLTRRSVTADTTSDSRTEP